MQLYISDLDGTLLNSRAELSEYSAQSLNKMIGGGLDFTVATARTIASAGKILVGANLKLPMILMNGVLIFDPQTRSYEVVNRLDTKLCSLIIAKMRSFGLDCFMYTLEGNMMHTVFERLSNRAMQEFYDERCRKYYKTFTQVESFSEEHNSVIYFTFIDTRERLAPLYEALSNKDGVGMTFYSDIYSEGMWYLEIFSAAASKENAVRYLREKFAPSKITVFGDNLNDLSLFRAADVKVAVGNAKKELLECADRVIGTNDEDSVVKYLEEVFYG